MTSKLRRGLFEIVWFFLARWNPKGTLFLWRSFILKFFGAEIEGVVYIYPSAQIWDPKNLKMCEGATLDEDVLIYNVAQISIGERAIISRNAKLCTATHNYNSENFNLISKPIIINNDAWICMDAFVAPGVEIGSFGVALARSVILNNIPDNHVYIGNPAKFKSQRNQIKRQYQ